MADKKQITIGAQERELKARRFANIFQGEVPDDSSEPFLRTELLDLIEKAGLTQSLITYIQRHATQLEKAGADAEVLSTIRLQEFRNTFFPQAPKAVVDKLLKELSLHSRKHLDEFSEEHPESTDLHLVRHLAGLRLHLLDPEIKITGVRERARCLIACLADSKHKGMVAALGSLLIKKPDVQSEKLLWLAALPIERPELVLQREHEFELDILIAACSVAIKLRDRETARRLLLKIKQREQSIPVAEHSYSVLQEEYQKVLPEFKDASHALKPKGTHQFSSAEGLEVLAICNKVIAPTKSNRHRSAFSRALAVRADGESEWLELDQSERERLFPLQGSIIHLEGHTYPQIPKYRSYSVWEVKSRILDEKQKSKHSTLLHAHRKKLAAHEALTLDHIGSEDHAKAREWLRGKDFSEHADGEVILRFSDNLFIKPLQTNRMLIQDKFNQRMLCWRSLPILHFLGIDKYIYIGDLPEAEQEYSLLTPAQEIAQQLKQLDGYKTHEKEKFVAALNAIGSNQAAHSRAAKLDPTEHKYEYDEIEVLAGLLGRTEEHLAELTSSYESEMNVHRKKLVECKKEHEELLALDKQIQKEMDTQQKAADSFESIIEARISNFLKLAGEKDDGLSTIVLLRKIDELGGRIKALEAEMLTARRKRGQDVKEGSQ